MNINVVHVHLKRAKNNIRLLKREIEIECQVLCRIKFRVGEGLLKLHLK